MPPRLAERSSKPTARTSRPDPEACSQRSSRPAPTTMTMKAMGIGPMLVRRNDTRSSLMIPWAVGRSVSEIPSRMLSVARVAMSDGILKPLISTALTDPTTEATGEDHHDTEQDLDHRGVAADQERADDDTEADHRPDRQVEVPDQDRVRLGDGRQRQRHRQQQDRRDVRLVEESVEPDLDVPEQDDDQQHLQHDRHPQSHLDDLAPLVLVAGVAGDLAGELSRPIDPGGVDRDDRHVDQRRRAPAACVRGLRASPHRAAIAPPSTSRVRARSPRRCAPRRARRRGSPRRWCLGTSRARGHRDPRARWGRST